MIGNPEYDDDRTAILHASASNRARDQGRPGGFAFVYDHAGCPLTLPPASILTLGQTAGTVDRIGSTFPVRSIRWWENMQAELARLVAMMDGSGWVRTRGWRGPGDTFDGTTVLEDFSRFLRGAFKWSTIGSWAPCDDPSIRVSLDVRHQGPSSRDAPPSPDPNNPFADNLFRFNMRFAFDPDSPVHAELRALRDARRRAAAGATDAALPLSVWLDDPDWRPYGWDGTYVP